MIKDFYQTLVRTDLSINEEASCPFKQTGGNNKSVWESLSTTTLRRVLKKETIVKGKDTTVMTPR